MKICDNRTLAIRGQELEGKGLNGLHRALVRLYPDDPPGTLPTEARLELFFHNDLELTDILNETTKKANAIFPITGGHRRVAGSSTGQVQVESIGPGSQPDSLVLTIRPVGDYSTYTVSVNWRNIDLMFSEVDFKFRPGCFNIDCRPGWEPGRPFQELSATDYLNKDYDSFRHTMMAAMIARVPGWQPTSEADLDQVLLELFSVAADELSDFQDRVVNEAYLASARKRVSLARHARLMDYHIHQGNQASTLLAVRTAVAQTIADTFLVGTKEDLSDPEARVFKARQSGKIYPHLSDISAYTWNDAERALASGSTEADLFFPNAGNKAQRKAAAKEMCQLIRDEEITQLLIQEHCNPATGAKAGRDPTKRQLLTLLAGDDNREKRAELIHDPFADEWLLRVRWEETDKLKQNYCFVIECPSGNSNIELKRDISLFHANLLHVCHGRPKKVVFKPESEPLSTQSSPDDPVELHYTVQECFGDNGNTNVVCELPDVPLAYTDTPPGGEVPPISTLTVDVKIPAGGSDRFEERISLVHSDASSENGDHFVVETDELGRSRIRFGNSVNGRRLPDGAEVHCTYQTGFGPDGNVGADTLVHAYDPGLSDLNEFWNPREVTNGRGPEPVAEIIRRVPEAYRARQMRAVTLRDYEERAQELSTVSRAAASYIWTGSWRGVRLCIDPVGKARLSDSELEDLQRHLEVVRLIGDDLEIREPHFVPLEISVRLCADVNYWPGDISYVLEQEFSAGLTPDGRQGFFHPDQWTFGQELDRSQIIGRIHQVEGVDHIIEIEIKRFNEATPGTATKIEVGANEIIQVQNDPDHMELGFIHFDVRGGRQ